MSENDVPESASAVGEEEAKMAVISQSIEEDENVITWRTDPQESFSDWIIEVTKIVPRPKNTCANDGDKKRGIDRNEREGEKMKNDGFSRTAIYHVHRYVLGGGPRRSIYFRGVFHSSQKFHHLEESNNSRSKIQLEASAFDAFPVFLDYIYNDSSSHAARDDDDDDDDDSSRATEDDDSLGVYGASTETAVALRHLGNYFGVPSLLESATKFIHADMTKRNVHVYCQEALLYHDSEILEKSIKVAAGELRRTIMEDTLDSGINEGEGNANEDETNPSPTQIMMDNMLSKEQQQTLFKAALKQSVEECQRLRNEISKFRRIPSSWQKNVFTTIGEPTMMPEDISVPREGYVVRWDELSKVCPLFYFDENPPPPDE